MKLAQGRKELIRHKAGNKLSYKQSVLAKCFECMGFYADGKIDCQIPGCPLYGFMPYRSKSSKINYKTLEIAKNGVSVDE